MSTDGRPDGPMWPEQIVAGVLVQQRLEEVDTQGLWQRHLPEVAATEAKLRAAESSLGVSLDPLYRLFLAHANGWRNFYTHVDLFGTAQLEGAEPMGLAREQLSALEPDYVITNSGLVLEDSIPIGASTYSSDTFLLGKPQSRQPGAVVWLAGYPVEVFPDFHKFFLAMLDHNRYLVTKLEGSAG